MFKLSRNFEHFSFFPEFIQFININIILTLWILLIFELPWNILVLPASSYVIIKCDDEMWADDSISISCDEANKTRFLSSFLIKTGDF